MTNDMDFSTTNMQVYRNEHFRTPLTTERAMGLWVDRIGETVNNASEKTPVFRRLGLYGAVYVKEGNGTFATKTRGQCKVKKNDIMILFPEEPHVYFPQRNWKTKWIAWSGPEAGVLQKTGCISPEFPVIHDQFGLFNHAYEQLAPLMHREDLGAILLRKNIILNMIYELYVCSQTTGKETGRAKEMQEAVLFVKNNFTNPISIPGVASRFNLSVTHFRRLFRCYTGRSPAHFITSLRISEAKRLLSQGTGIKETASSVGYSNVFYFMRVFKKTTGMTAGAFTGNRLGGMNKRE